MLNWIRVALVAGWFLFVSMAWAASPERGHERFLLSVATAAASGPAGHYGVELVVGQLGEVTVASTSRVDGGMKVKALIVNVDGAEPRSGLRRQVKVLVSVHEQLAGAWVSQGDALVMLTEGLQQPVVLSSTLGELTLQVAVNSIRNTTPVQQKSVLSAREIRPQIGKVCCAARCGDGSDKELRCCASSFTCYGCGTSCSGDDR